MREEGYRTRDTTAPRAAESTPVLQLRVVGGPQAVVVDRQCTIGTARGNTLVLGDPYVSRHHCTLQHRDGGLWLQDERSRNGTWVNNVRVDRCTIGAGSRIVVGRTALQLGDGPTAWTQGIIGQHPTILKVRDQIARLAVGLRAVLIVGETGTGKELVARALHEHSVGRQGPFEPLNCGAIPRDLAEAELFGHAQGAFTGASRDRKGAFERANHGTLFLDEIGEMPASLQPKILRALEEGVVQRIGEEQRRSVDLQIIAATHRDLLREADRGRFRLDLYHRLAIGVIQLPPLRDRPEDIPLLVRHFLQRTGIASLEVDPAALVVLQRHSWPGNVRQLRNAIQRAAALSDGGLVLRAADFSFLAEPAPPPVEQGTVRCLGRSFRDIRREIYLQNLDACGGNRSAAAAALAIPKSTFFDHLHTMGIE
jgi:DNA-binding NtrC family response regulator